MELENLPQNPVPQGAEVLALQVPGSGLLRTAVFPATAAKVRGTVIIVQGRTETIEKYFEVIGELRQRGFAVAVFDLPGQGRSQRLVPGGLGHIDSYSQYLAALDTVVSAARQRLPGPFVLLGHSMGGHIALRALMRGSGGFDRAVLSSPFLDFGLDVGMPRWRMWLIGSTLSLLGQRLSAVPGGDSDAFKQPPFEKNELTSDPARYARWMAILSHAPDLVTGPPTVGWMMESMASMALIEAPGALEAVTPPLLVSSSGRDTVVSLPAIAAACARLPGAVHFEVAGSKHETLQETDGLRADWWARFDAFAAGL